MSGAWMESNHHNIAITQRSAVELHAHIVPNNCPARYHTASIRSGCVDASRWEWPQPRTLLSDRTPSFPCTSGLFPVAAAQHHCHTMLDGLLLLIGIFIIKLSKSNRLLRRTDSNRRPTGYGPVELPLLHSTI